MGGDFNWAPAAVGRRSCSDAGASGHRNHREESHFNAVLRHPFGLEEMHQPEMAFASSRARSRLDRIYCSRHVSEQLDREIKAAALEWKPHCRTTRRSSLPD
eukprot:3474441-Pyramimonas_sp.AAC.1